MEFRNMPTTDIYDTYISEALGCGCGCAYHNTRFLTINEENDNTLCMKEYSYYATITSNQSDYFYKNSSPFITNIKLVTLYEYYVKLDKNIYFDDSYIFSDELTVHKIINDYVDDLQKNLKLAYNYLKEDNYWNNYSTISKKESLSNKIYKKMDINILNSIVIILSNKCKISIFLKKLVNNFEHDKFLITDDIEYNTHKNSNFYLFTR